MYSLLYVHEILRRKAPLDDKIEWMTKRERKIKIIRENLCYLWCKKKFHKEKISVELCVTLW